MTAFKKTVRIGHTTETGSTFVTINFDGKRLSLQGVEGPYANGNCKGGCGQIVDSIVPGVLHFAEGWDRDMLARLIDIWHDWHLNDMRAGNPQQIAWLKANPVSHAYPVSHYEAASAALDAAGLNPHGDRYGSKWHHVDVPADVIEWLAALPEADKPLPGRWAA